MSKDTAQFTISIMHLEDLEAATEVRLQSWLDTYANDEFGVTREWVEARNEQQRSPKKVEARRARLLEDSKTAAWVAKDLEGNVIGAVTPYTDDEGVQHVGSLYVDKKFHSTGVGSALMQKIIDWSDPTKPIVLGVVSYNERAKAFYRKWGFKEIPNSETLFADKIPEVMMRRKGDKQ